MKAYHKDYALRVRLLHAGADVHTEDCRTLRRAELTLQRWAERECGDGSNWHLERDEDTGKPYNVYNGPEKWRGPGFAAFAIAPQPTADLEAGALRRVAAVCERNGLHYYHQTDPRGCALYVSTEPLTPSNYSSGVACCVE